MVDAFTFSKNCTALTPIYKQIRTFVKPRFSNSEEAFCDNDPTWTSQGPRGVFCLGVGQGSNRFTSKVRKALFEVVQQILGLEVQTFILFILGLEVLKRIQQ